ncbi:conserved hypothetical protein [Uncinocarpus reesii 1704]|uniref:Response regulatory domain-containing protein n=1 Tax=Uncinocarpus reesii (strain UAMH 1704) TaxID=336963 RepID=C4JLG0_UNCRE|nr:uncharacterized protein UREG_03668 [Uncinocarpus reesii 1704]EEP78822.1 conserved hypothetical protein [Uncinocarpus reesii 1704]
MAGDNPSPHRHHRLSRLTARTAKLLRRTSTSSKNHPSTADSRAATPGADSHLDSRPHSSSQLHPGIPVRPSRLRTTPSTRLTAEAPKRGGSLRRLEEFDPAGTPKDGGIARSPSLSLRRPESRSTTPRALNAVDESGQGINAPSSFHIPKTKPLPATSPPPRPPLAVRRQSLVPAHQHRLINNLLDPGTTANTGDYFSRPTPAIQPDMISRKVWVKRGGSSATLVSVTEEDLVDDLREAILKKYTNSLGRTFDAPDIVLKLIPREPSSRQSNPERLLGPEELVGQALDHYYPGGQSVGEALLIEIPPRRTPRPSPHHNVPYGVHPEAIRPGEPDEYFPPMHSIQPSNVPGSLSSASIPSTHQHSMSVINGVPLPPVPSPGSCGSWHNVQHRPQLPRQPTSSPTMNGATPATTWNQPINSVAPIPSTSIYQHSFRFKSPEPANEIRTYSPNSLQKLRKMGKLSSGATVESNNNTSGLLDVNAPPINVLIVEDNTINLKLLEAFMKRLKVRWQTAMNGREAVNKWRGGGFHLVLMDIQLPVMNGLEATREIRRLERVNNIGVFSKGVAPTSPHAMVSTKGNHVFPPQPEDLIDKGSSFKSPVIIVALTASSLQSDRDEALAAGCNDFLTKGGQRADSDIQPVNMMWLEKKVKEWGCMQALIDFEAWLKWRGYDSSPSDPISRQSTTNTIIGGPLTNSPSLAPTSKLSQEIIPARLATENGKSVPSQRESSPAPTSKIPGASIYKSGKDSSASSASTIVPKGAALQTSAGKNSSQTEITPMQSAGKRGNRASTPAKTSS